MFNSRTYFNCLVDSSSICCTISCCDAFVIRSLSTALVDIRILWRLIGTGVRSVFALSVRVELGNDLHRIVMLSLGHVHFPVSSAQFWWEEITLGWPDLWVMSLHLDLMVNTWGDIARRWIRLRWSDCVVWWLLIVYRTSIVGCCRFREQVVLVRWSLQMLSVNILLGSRDLNLYIRLALPVPTSNCLCFTSTFNSLLLVRTIELLLSIVHDLIRWWGITN